MSHLDKDAVAFAREKYKEKMNKIHISEEVDGLTDEEFLTKLKLVSDGRITNAAMLLLGNAEYDNLFESAPSVMWRLIEADGTVKDYLKFPTSITRDILCSQRLDLTKISSLDKSAILCRSHQILHV
ncbi:MAG: hypothetical protein VZR11_07030 [Succinimonas sp.]|nr:hypothetical protein [Succinimonas sp.]